MVGQFYMGNDYRRDHSFRIPRPDLTLKLGSPNACTDCHTDKSATWAQGYIEKWYGTKKRPHYGEIFAKANHADPKAIPALILYAENELFPLMIRATAVQLLGNYNDSLSNRALEKALNDPASLVRHSAVMSYPPSDAKTYEKHLLPLLNDPVMGIRAEAAIRLSQVPESMLGEPAKKAMKAAMEEYRKSNLYSSDFPGGRFNLGVMYANAGKLDLAVKAYEEALKIDGLFNRAKVNLAMVYNQQKKNDEAEKLLREVLVENPEIVDINYSLALLLAEMEKYDESRKYFLKAMELIPDNARIVYNLALLENSLGNYGEAEKYLLRALNKEPDNFDFLYGICTFYLGHQQNGKALPFVNKLINTYPDNPVGKQLLEAASK
jgi:tetratricopeptide (TPR) repeat protein